MAHANEATGQLEVATDVDEIVCILQCTVCCRSEASAVGSVASEAELRYVVLT